MAPKTVKKYCHILQYIEQVDPELHAAIGNLCMARAFSPRRGLGGVTFLRPDAKSDVRKLIITETYGDNAEKAVDALRSLILLDCFKSASDWNSKKSDIPNALRQKVELKSADEKEVKLACGAVLKKDPKFTPRSDRDNLSVYVLSGASIPLNGKESTLEHSRKSKEKKVGGSWFGPNSNDERKALLDRSNQKLLEDLEDSDQVYLDAVVSFLDWSRNKYLKNDAHVYHSHVFVCGYGYFASFMTLFEPYTKNPSTISHEDFLAWYEVAKSVDHRPFGSDLVGKLQFHLNGFSETYANPEVKVNIQTSKDSIRDSAAKPIIGEKITKVYQNYVELLKLSALSKQLPSPSVKLCHDEIHLISQQKFKDVIKSSDKSEIIGELDNILGFLKASFGNGKSFSESELYKRSDIISYYSIALPLVNSEFFLRLPNNVDGKKPTLGGAKHKKRVRGGLDSKSFFQKLGTLLTTEHKNEANKLIEKAAKDNLNKAISANPVAAQVVASVADSGILNKVPQ